jgi:hypothetical protein
MDTRKDIYRIPLKVEKEYQPPKQTDILLTETEAGILAGYKAEERLIILHGLRSKNKSARRRANKLIEKGARRGRN